jgi:hypothetical protein
MMVMLFQKISRTQSLTQPQTIVKVMENHNLSTTTIKVCGDAFILKDEWAKT